MLVFGDMHLMNHNDDLLQFGSVLEEINRYTFDHPMEKIYGLTLGVRQGGGRQTRLEKCGSGGKPCVYFYSFTQ